MCWNMSKSWNIKLELHIVSSVKYKLQGTHYLFSFIFFRHLKFNKAMSFFRFLGTPFAAKNTARDEGGRCVSMQTLALVSLCLLTAWERLGWKRFHNFLILDLDREQTFQRVLWHKKVKREQGSWFRGMSEVSQNTQLERHAGRRRLVLPVI